MSSLTQEANMSFLLVTCGVQTERLPSTAAAYLHERCQLRFLWHLIGIMLPGQLPSEGHVQLV